MGDRLDGIHHQDVRLHPVGQLDDMLDIRGGGNKQPFPFHAQAVGPQLDLAGAFLPGNIQYLFILTQHTADLHEQGGFADTGIAGNQHHRSQHNTAAQHPVKFAQAGVVALLLSRIHCIQRLHRLTEIHRLGDGFCRCGGFRADFF